MKFDEVREGQDLVIYSTQHDGSGGFLSVPVHTRINRLLRRAEAVFAVEIDVIEDDGKTRPINVTRDQFPALFEREYPLGELVKKSAEFGSVRLVAVPDNNPKPKDIRPRW